MNGKLNIMKEQKKRKEKERSEGRKKEMKIGRTKV